MLLDCFSVHLPHRDRKWNDIDLARGIWKSVRMRRKKPVVLLTGGAGFLGRATVRELTRPRGEPVLSPREIRVFDVEPGDRAEAGGIPIIPIRGDVCDPEAVRRACAGADAVFHLAAIVDWGSSPEARIRDVNVGGTASVVEACAAEGVAALVHTSSEDAVYDGGPIRDGDETLAYPTQFSSVYCETKAQSERIVLEANGRPLAGARKKLRCSVVRPCSIYGEEDRFHVGSLLALGRRGPIVRIGNGRARNQAVYVGNVAHLEILLARALLEGRQRTDGQVFYAVDHPPANFFDFYEPIVTALGCRMLPWRFSIPEPVMTGLGTVNDAAAFLLKPLVAFKPLVSRFAVCFVCQDHTYKSDKAARLLGYAPIYSKEEAFERTIASFRSPTLGADLRPVR